MINRTNRKSLKNITLGLTIFSCIIASGCHEPGHNMNLTDMSANNINPTSSNSNYNISNTGNFIETTNVSQTQTPKSQTDNLIAAQQLLEASIEEIPTLTAVGYAVVSTQPGRSDAQKRLMAIRAARMAAMRDLAEQIHGLQVDSNTTVIDLMVQNDTFRGIVSGTIRGARTVRINPTGSDTYEIVLEIDREMMTYLLSVARQA